MVHLCIYLLCQCTFEICIILKFWLKVITRSNLITHEPAVFEFKFVPRTNNASVYLTVEKRLTLVWYQPTWGWRGCPTSPECVVGCAAADPGNSINLGIKVGVKQIAQSHNMAHMCRTSRDTLVIFYPISHSSPTDTTRGYKSDTIQWHMNSQGMGSYLSKYKLFVYLSCAFQIAKP